MAKRKQPRGAAGSEAHYEDGRYYDQAYRRRRHDVRFYTGLAVESGGPVLELGAGTGRVALAIAKAGIDVVGIEPMEPMLEQARERLARLSRAARDRVELRKGDVERLRLRRKFPLVIAPFNVWMHLYAREDIERSLPCGIISKQEAVSLSTCCCPTWSASLATRTSGTEGVKCRIRAMASATGTASTSATTPSGKSKPW
ncbi:MAG: class I SAM-dependent methyltransferase [Deltaproteobacteria bacterium]|nr:class I SAM-dependent methyltransferase [Deltaproteobacteria bacterium]